MEARMANRFIPPNARLQFPRRGDDAAMPAFPETRHEVKELSVAQCDAILGYYDLPVAGRQAEKQTAIEMYIGII
jgi:hypothetical protein